MRALLAIAGKELRVYFTTWTAWVLLVGFLELVALFFFLLVQEFQQTRLRYVEARAVGILNEMNLTDLVMGPLFSYMATFFIFILPVLTMRLIAGEKRGRSMELLMTLPVPPVAIVVGKYLAAATVMLLMLAITLVFPLMLASLGTEPGAVDWQTLGAGYLGVALLGLGGLAVGLFASAVTESQVVAVVISFATLLGLMVIGLAAASSHGFWQEALAHLSLSNHLHSFVRGVVRSVDVVYYLSLLFVGLFLAWRVVEAQRWR